MNIRFFAVVLVLAAFNRPASAADFTVDTFFDVVDTTPGDGHCAGTLDLCSLRAAIMEANTLPGDDIVHLPQGTYTLSLPSTPDEDAGADGDLDVTENLTIIGEGSAVTTVDGNGVSVHERVLHVLPSVVSFAMTGVEIRNGDATTNGGAAQTAGGILIEGNAASVLTDVAVDHNTGDPGGGVVSSGPVTLANSFIDDNTSLSAVGGIAVTGGASLTLTDTSVEGNVAATAFGAGVLGQGDLTITGGSISHNRIPGGAAGGVLQFLPSSELKMTGVTVEDNEANTGGGVVSLGQATLEDCEILGNRSTSATKDGGGVLVDTAGLSITGGRIADNSSGQNGGGVAANGPVTLTGVTLEGNTAVKSGGAFVNISTEANELAEVTMTGNAAGVAGGAVAVAGPLSLTDGTVADNSAIDFGGGIYRLAAQPLEIVRTTVRDNQAGSIGGGIFAAGGDLTLSDSTVSGNKAYSGAGGGLLFSGANAALTNVTVSGNAAGTDGGGAAVNGTANVINATFFGNEASNGGNYDNAGGTSTFLNTILASPVSGGNCFGSVVSAGFNIEDANDCAFAGTGDKHDTDPMLGPLADNGGSTFTHALLDGSPAIDGGTDAGAPDHDQRALPRPIDGNADGTPAFDVGAVEFDRCGDGVQTPDEACDDGNTTDGDGCSSACEVEAPGTTGGGTTSGTTGGGSGGSAGGGCSLIR